MKKAASVQRTQTDPKQDSDAPSLMRGKSSDASRLISILSYRDSKRRSDRHIPDSVSIVPKSGQELCLVCLGE